MAILDLQFPVAGRLLPVDHGFMLYSALCAQSPVLHGGAIPVAIGPISGQWRGNGLLAVISQRSFLRLRIPANEISTMLSFAGASLAVGRHEIRLGTPTVQTLVPASCLMSRLVTIKNFTDAEPFLTAARRQLDALHIEGALGVPVLTDGPRQGQPRRKILHIHDKAVVGFTLHVANLTADESIRLQEHGLGGRRRMGCGFFVPLHPRAS